MIWRLSSPGTDPVVRRAGVADSVSARHRTERAFASASACPHAAGDFGLCTGQKVGGAARGYNPHHRKVPSDYPIRAYLADSGHPASDASCASRTTDSAAKQLTVTDFGDPPSVSSDIATHSILSTVAKAGGSMDRATRIA